eukprot:2249322-Pyramimonas_sp.AAC.1
MGGIDESLAATSSTPVSVPQSPSGLSVSTNFEDSFYCPKNLLVCHGVKTSILQVRTAGVPVLTLLYGLMMQATMGEPVPDEDKPRRTSKSRRLAFVGKFFGAVKHHILRLRKPGDRIIDGDRIEEVLQSVPGSARRGFERDSMYVCSEIFNLATKHKAVTVLIAPELTLAWWQLLSHRTMRRLDSANEREMRPEFSSHSQNKPAFSISQLREDSAYAVRSKGEAFRLVDQTSDDMASIALYFLSPHREGGGLVSLENLGR